MASLHRSNRLLALLALACSLALLVGCGSGGPSAEGTVTFNGAPVDGGKIIFVPSGGAGPVKVRPASADIKDGKYFVDDLHNLTPGPYRVEIFWKQKTGKKVVNRSDPPNKIDETRQVIPPKYNKASRATVEVKPGANKFDYTLTSK
jgi:hypothetical protein